MWGLVGPYQMESLLFFAFRPTSCELKARPLSPHPLTRAGTPQVAPISAPEQQVRKSLAGGRERRAPRAAQACVSQGHLHSARDPGSLGLTLPCLGGCVLMTTRASQKPTLPSNFPGLFVFCHWTGKWVLRLWGRCCLGI